MHASNSKTESHVDSIVNDSILDPSSMGAISVPPGEEHQEVATQVWPELHLDQCSLEYICVGCTLRRTFAGTCQPDHGPTTDN